MHTTMSTPIVPPPGEWMRIFACRLAQARPELDAGAIVQTAVREFPRCQGLPPEVAAQQCLQPGAARV
jgi:hypothetical protein